MPRHPEQDLSWSSFNETTIFPNGDIAVNARISDAAAALWLLRQGERPRRMLQVGQTVPLQTGFGAQQAIVNGYSRPGAGSAVRYLSGNDSGAGADGSILVQGGLTNCGKVWILSLPTDYIFQDGFGD